LLHDLTYYEISEYRAQRLIERLVKVLGPRPAKVVLNYTLSFIAKEMPKAKVVQTVKDAYLKLYNEAL
jgi:hypothetical protein